MEGLVADDERRPSLWTGEIRECHLDNDNRPAPIGRRRGHRHFSLPGIPQSLFRQPLPVEHLQVPLEKRLDERVRLAVVRHDDGLTSLPCAGQVPRHPILDLCNRGSTRPYTAAMLIGAVADIHRNFEALARAITRHPGVPFWICVGDVASRTGAYPEPAAALPHGPAAGAAGRQSSPGALRARGRSRR